MFTDACTLAYNRRFWYNSEPKDAVAEPCHGERLIMKFEVKIRNAKGGLDGVEIEADDRVALFALLKERGLSAASVSEVKDGVGRRLSSGSYNGQAGLVKGLAALVIILAGAAIAYFCLSRTSTPDVVNGQEKSRGSAIKDFGGGVTVTRPEPISEVRAKQNGRRVVSHAVEERSSVSNESAAAEAASDNAAVVSNNGERVARRSPFKSQMEQLISMAVPATQGGVVPPLPVLSEEESEKVENATAEIADIMKGFANELKAEETDSDATLERKEVVSVGKEEFGRLIKEGYTLRQYVEALRKRYNDDAVFLSEAQKIMGETLDDPTVSDEDCQAMKTKIDKLLEERGMKPLDPDYDLNGTDTENDTTQGESK